MADDDDIVLLACAMAIAAAALTIKDELIDDDLPDRKPQLRFVRPETSYLDYQDMQRDLLYDRGDLGDRVIYDIFRMDGASLHVLVAMATPYLPGRINPRDVEQFFLDKGFSTLHHYRTIVWS
ncbi:hypothetical protein SDRG_08520 [Saprolegnia diclina VS20]|uniref:Uncharacterized protein n=1 Tax=Saprolegnia diclina (strain VS20) TaxID=1156394 RepID=T0Q7I9_SAPDV|nr:hypothetical protein SDRG_08520 [Saprolegnia diclina VS20]EQC33839.1 hypothetical protein SDRG_08520 [Saprolegnia diclina VS20]|eukprot:XP_008612634.1 hypothetical protein SDRG_08520 [Saprolegnia diclina VS20]